MFSVLMFKSSYRRKNVLICEGAASEGLALLQYCPSSSVQTAVRPIWMTAVPFVINKTMNSKKQRQ